MDNQRNDSEAALLRGLFHDLRQYVAAGSLLADMPPDDQALPVQHRLARMARIFMLLQDIIDTQLHPSAQAATLIDLVDLVDDCVGVLSAPRRASVMKAYCGHPAVCGDPVALRRAVGNLLDNALRAAGERGVVEVEVGGQGLLAYVQVTDDGAGFGRVPAGDGQGMAVVASVVHAMGGKLDISSGPGAGTTVRVSVPSHQQIEVAS